MRPDVVEHFGDRPVFPDRHVVRRHETADRSFPISEQTDRLRAFLRRQQREQFPCGFGRQFLEERRPIVGRHVVEQCRRFLGGHRLQQRVLLVERQVRERLRSVLARQDPEDEHLFVERQVGQDRCEIAGTPVAQRVAQPADVAIANEPGDLVGRPDRLAHELQRSVAVGAVQLLFHRGEGGPDDVAVMDARTDRAHDVEPQAMDLFVVFGTE